jgi:hypothetical protein
MTSGRSATPALAAVPADVLVLAAVPADVLVLAAVLVEARLEV